MMPIQVMPIRVLLLPLLLGMGASQEPQRPPARIGVIGAGIGGTSAAYFLRQKFGRDVHIDVFEKGEVGGRMATLNIDGQDYEAGALLIFPSYVHIHNFIKELGLSTIPREYIPRGVSNGEEFVYKESGCIIRDLVQVLWKYGLDAVRMFLWVEAGNYRFKRIHDYQSQDQAFSSNEDLFHAVGEGGCSTQGLNETMEEAMQKAGYSHKFITEIMTPGLKLVYGQGAKLNCFLGLLTSLVALPGKQSVKGGNKLVCSGLLSVSNAQLISGTVLSLKEKTPQKGHSAKQYEVTFRSESGLNSEVYDMVLIATPLQPEIANITFHNFNPPIPEITRPYYREVVTFVRGHINATYFGHQDPSQFKLRAIAITNNPKINGILKDISVKGSQLKPPLDSSIWVIYSPESLTKEQLNLLFSSYDTVKEKAWLGWPQYYLPIKLPPIILHDHLYYLNGAEMIGSFMEMSVVAAKNAVLLAHQRWHGKLDKVDLEGLKTEL